MTARSSEDTVNIVSVVLRQFNVIPAEETHRYNICDMITSAGVFQVET